MKFTLPGKIFYSMTLACLISCTSDQTQIVQTRVAENAHRNPNILLIVADDLGYGDLGSYGQNKIKTPQLDRMAQEGIRFTQHYSGSSVCGPSRVSLLTGFDTGHSQVRGNPKWTKSGNPVDIKAEDITIAEVLKTAGYRTGIVGKWGLSENTESLEAMPNQQGFDFFYGYRTHKSAHHYYWKDVYRNNELEPIEGNNHLDKTGLYTHDLYTSEAIQFIEQGPKNSPWFLMVNYTIPHLELTVPEDSKRPYKGLSWPERKMNTQGHYRNDPEGNVTFAAMVSRMDRDVGRLMQLLREQALAENTLVVFVSDNGHEYDNGFFDSNGALRGRKRDLYEGGIRIPFIAWWPGTITGNRVSDHISAFWDFMPTICELSHSSCPDNNGVSFVPTLVNKTDEQQQHDYLYWEINEKKGPIQALRKGDWKLVKKADKPLELYNLQSDIAESNNLASDQPERSRAMLELLTHARTEHLEFPLERLKKK